MAGAVRSGLDLLAAWRACPGTAGQCCVRRRRGPGGGVAAGAERVSSAGGDDRSADHAASPVPASVIGAVEREVSQSAGLGCAIPQEARLASAILALPARSPPSPAARRRGPRDLDDRRPLTLNDAAGS